MKSCMRLLSIVVGAGLFSLGTLSLSGCTSSTAETSNTSTPTSEKILADLAQGNADYLTGNLATLTTQSQKSVMLDQAKGQTPDTIILSCSDSRVPPEIIFNKGLGKIFVIRVAGNVIDKDQLGSIEYAIEHIGTPKVLMVLGHSKCGAVKATAEAVKAKTAIDAADNIGGILSKIKPAVDTAFKNYTGLDRLVDAAVDENVKLVAESMKLKSKIIEEATKPGGPVKLVMYRYDVSTGQVKEVK